MASVVLRIANLPNAASATRKTFPFAVLDDGDILIKSQLPADTPLNEHLVWFWGMLQNERRHLKSLQAEGAVIAVQASGLRGPVEIKPNGAEMLHLLGASLVITGRP